MTATLITPLQALRRLVDIARLIDADECPELYNQLQGELTVAGAVLATQADDFAHFLSYSGLSAESEEVKEKMRRAFEAGQPPASKAALTPPDAFMLEHSGGEFSCLFFQRINAERYVKENDMEVAIVPLYRAAVADVV